MDPVNKLYFFNWMILIGADYVVYIMCVCVISVIVDFIYFLLIIF